MNGGSSAEAEIKIMCHGEVMVVYMLAPVRLSEFEREVRDACNLTPYDKMTVKWVDDEGDPCTIGTQTELDAAFRCYFLQQDKSLIVHIFLGEPPAPGMVSPGEDKTVYRRGARRWKKFYRVNGHRFQAKRFNKRAQCQFCGDNIWGLGRQGYRCVDCRLAVHKRCHRAVKAACCDQIYTNAHQSPSYPTLPQRAPQGILNNAFVELDPDSQDVEVSGINNNSMELKPLPVDSTREVNKTMEENYVKCLSQFDVLHCIGRGSYAKVLLVELRSTKKLYAMKVIKKEMFIPDAEGDRDEDIDWVQTEKSVYETATNHPFLVGLHSCFQSRSRLFFVIEFVPGGDLMFHMQQKRKLTEDHARFFAAEVVLALHYLHAHYIIYRDLKLDNVLIDADGHIKLTDYGMCKENMGPNDRTSTFCGTPNYIAPELLRGDSYGYSVDWWALGVLMFEMMAGRSPFDSISDDPDKNSEDYLFHMILDRPIRIPRSLSVKATSILKGFLNKNPKDRLGCTSTDIYQCLTDIKSTHFFRSIDFDALEERAIEPPYHPEISSECDLRYFDTKFTDESTDLTPVDESILNRIDQTEFEGFEYTNPLLMSAEDSV